MHPKVRDRDDVLEYWSELEREVYQDAWNEFRQKPRPSKQGWVLMDSTKFIKLVRNAYDGTLSKIHKGWVDEYVQLIFYNWIKLDFNTKMVGHTEHDPLVILKEFDIIATQTQINIFCDWVSDDAYSDYGLQPIAKLLIPMMLQKNYSLKVQIMADIIGITHMRGDLAAFFVQKGSQTHAQIEVYESTSDRE